MQKVCLIKCPSSFLIDERVYPPLGLMAVGTWLKSKGHDVDIYDGCDIPMNYTHYGLGPTTPEYPYAKKILKDIRKLNPSARVIIGGPHATVNPEECWNDGFDNVFEGGLDDYPIIDRTLVDIKSYKYFINGNLATTVMTSFGCPYNCAFCCKTYDAVKMRSAEDVIEEIKYLHNDFGYKAIMFFDDIFILNKDRTEKICQCLKELGITWRCFVRGDLILRHGEAFVKMMAESGCAEVGMGIESGSDKILQAINKGETVDTIKTAIEMLKDEGIRVKGFFIIGLPGESADTIRETQVFLKDVDLDDKDLTIFQPYSGSDIWKCRDAYDIGWDDLDYKKMFYKGRQGEYQSFVWTSTLSADDIVKARFELAG